MFTLVWNYPLRKFTFPVLLIATLDRRQCQALAFSTYR